MVVFPFCFTFFRSGKKLTPLFLVALAGGGGIFCFTYALIYGDVVKVMVLFYLLPVWGVLGGYAFLHEKIDGVRKVGVVVAVIGAYLILGGNAVFETHSR